jgi:hypothetical protein
MNSLAFLSLLHAGCLLKIVANQDNFFFSQVVGNAFLPTFYRLYRWAKSLPITTGAKPPDVLHAKNYGI